MFEDKKCIDCSNYTPPDLDPNSISLSPSSLDRGPVYEAPATGRPWENLKDHQPWSDEPEIFPADDNMITVNPDPVPTAHLPTAHPTGVPMGPTPVAYTPAQRIRSLPKKTPGSRRRRGRSFSSLSLSDKRNENLIPRRRNARNRRQLVIKMIDEIILGNESLIGPDQHTDAYDEFISRRGLENAPQSHV